MAWNGSNSKVGQCAQASAVKTKKNSSIGYLLAVSLVAVLVIGMFFVLFIGDNREPANPAFSDNKKTLINEQTPAVVKSQGTNRSEIAKIEQQPKAPPLTKHERHAIAVSNKLAAARAKSPWGHLPRRTIGVREAPRRFDHISEGYIAHLLEVEPGTPIFGEIPMDERFLQDLKQAMIFPTKDKDDDDAYTKDVKGAVRETVQDLKERMLNCDCAD